VLAKHEVVGSKPITRSSKSPEKSRSDRYYFLGNNADLCSR